MNKPKSRNMQDGFEKEVQRRMQDFNLEPSPEVWNEIKATLNEKKRRRFIFWWWLLPLMLAGGSIGWFYYANYKNYTPSTANNQTQRTNENKDQGITEENKDEQEKERRNAKQEGTTNSNHPGSSRSNNSDLSERAVTDKNYQSKIDQTKIEAADITPLSETNKNIQQNDKGINPVNSNIDILQRQLSLSVNGRDDSAFQLSLKDSAGKTAQKNKVEIDTRKRGNWLIAVGAGLTSTKEQGSSSLLDPDKSFDRQNGAVAGPGNYAPSSDSTSKIIKPENGFHFMAGIEYEYPLSNKWTISSGLQYRFLTNKQKTGKYIDSSSTNYSSVNSGSEYYQAGFKNDITNRAHWLEIPLNIAFNINPAAKTKILFRGGLSYAWMFGDKWLIPDSRNNKLYYSAQLLNKNIFSWQTGTAITLPSGWMFRIQYQQSISTVADKSVEPHLYWQNFSLHTAFPLR